MISFKKLNREKKILLKKFKLNKMSLFLSLFLNFSSALSWIMLVHYIDSFVDKNSNEQRRARRKVVYRIASAVIITIINHGMYFLATSTLEKTHKWSNYYELGFDIVFKIFKVLLVNSVLFFGNWLCESSKNFVNVKDTFQNRDLNFWKSIVIAPFLEEMLFTVLPHWSFGVFL
jgi:Type II CAAX prenyl endopeptidase Rce1-like